MPPCLSNTVLSYIGNGYYVNIWSSLNIGFGLTELQHKFKARHPFYFIGRYQSETSLKIRWILFGSSHGKGEHDGAGIVIKWALTHEQLKSDGVHMNCAAHVVDF